MSASAPMPGLAEQLEGAGVQRDVVAWAEAHADWPSAWESCPRGDWLLAFAARFGAPTGKIALATVCAVQSALRGTYLEPIYEETLASAREQLEAGQQSVDLGSLKQNVADPNFTVLSEALELLQSVHQQPEVGAAVAAQTLSVVVSASGDCATMSVIRYTHQVMADAVRVALPVPPPLPVGTTGASG